jgi:hypothetical protein
MMRTEVLPSSFHDGTCAGIEFDMEARRLIMEVSDENRRGFYRLYFEECAGVSYTYQDDSEDPDTSLLYIMSLLEKTESGSRIRYFEIEFCDDTSTLLEIRCCKFYMEPIDGFTMRTYLSRLE